MCLNPPPNQFTSRSEVVAAIEGPMVVLEVLTAADEIHQSVLAIRFRGGDGLLAQVGMGNILIFQDNPFLHLPEPGHSGLTPSRQS